ncbi:helix-turn-helix transcriptional regulator [Streptomyces sp. NPDC047014]|uniref:helix-turn-helix transcriptional regulator n=1 Tax=Streptomyces sp. NPDC047014 TaxID=3155736 RepID=UPI0033F558BE
MTANHLGEFLRARRAALQPQEVGMASHGVRRVAGLRREEVAVLAGINVDYYTRLEQGRERHPSPQVLDSLARALRLTHDARSHLHHLAGSGTAPGSRRSAASGAVDPALRRLLDGQTGAPAFVIDETLDVLAANSLAYALHSPFEQPGNLARMIFLDPAGRRFYVDWDSSARTAAAHLRRAAGLAPDDARLRALVGDLRARSAEFVRLWNTHDVREKTQGTKRLLHPEAGPLTLAYQSFDVRAAPGQQLVVYLPAPGSADERALERLGAADTGGPGTGASRTGPARTPSRPKVSP